MMNTLVVRSLLSAALLLAANDAAAFAPATTTGAASTRRRHAVVDADVVVHRGRSSSPAFVRSNLDTRRYNFFENIGSMISNFGKQATASHILIGPKTMNEADAIVKLNEIKESVGNDPVKFAEAASEYSTCPSKAKGGSLGSFGPGMMVKNFDRVCFEEEVGVVHGPIPTQFGVHLIYLEDRTGDK